MCSSRTPSLFARTAIVISFVLASGPVAAQPSPGRPAAHASDAERLADLDLRYGDAYTESKGVGMRKAGIALTAVGGVALGVGIPSISIGATADDSESLWPAMLLGLSSYLLVPGIVALSVGVPMLVKGNRRRARYHEWLDEQDSRARLARRSARVGPVVAAGRQGWALGLHFSF